MVALIMAMALMGLGGTGGEPAGGSPTPVGEELNTPKGFSDDNETWERVGRAAEAFFTDQAAKDDKFVQQYRYGHKTAWASTTFTETERWGPGANKMHANLTFAHVNATRAELIAHEPLIEIEPRDNDGGANPGLQMLVNAGFLSSVDEGKRIFADAAEDMAQHSYSRCYTQEENIWAVQDSFTRGLGVTKETFDTDRKLDRSDRLFRHEVFVDSFARHTIRQARYVVHTIIEPFESARERFKKWGCKIEKANFMLADSPAMKGQSAGTAEQGEKDAYKSREFWIKDGDKRVLKFQDALSNEFIHQLPVWPTGKLEVDDFPYSFLRFNAQGVFFNDAFTELEVIDELRAAYERIIQFLDEKTFRGMAPMIFVDKSVSDETVKKIKASKTLEIERVDFLGKNIKEMVQLLDLQSSSGPTVEVALMFKQLADEITGLDEILRGAFGREGMTAKEASIRDDQAKSRTGLKLKALDGFFNSQLRHRLGICHARVPLQVVEQVCGYRARVVWEAIGTGAGLDEILAEFSVGVGAGSSSQRQKQEKMDNLEKLRAGGHQENEARQAVGLPPKVDTMQILLEQARQDGARNVERFLLPEPPPPPPAPPQGPAMPGAAAPGVPQSTLPPGPVGAPAPQGPAAGPNIQHANMQPPLQTAPSQQGAA